MHKRIPEDSYQRILAGQHKSAEIQHQRRVERITEYNKNPKRCAQCNNPLEYDKRKHKFCSHSCAATYNNCGRERKHEKIQCSLICFVCGKPRNRNTSKYCSVQCQANYKWECAKQEIEQTGLLSSTRVAKRYLREKHGNQCSICNLTEWNGQPMPLVLDHINGHSEDNSVKNLRFVCGNCDMQLPTYKGKNFGNGRHKRRERYAAGKSY